MLAADILQFGSKHLAELSGKCAEAVWQKTEQTTQSRCTATGSNFSYHVAATTNTALADALQCDIEPFTLTYRCAVLRHLPALLLDIRSLGIKPFQTRLAAQANVVIIARTRLRSMQCSETGHIGGTASVIMSVSSHTATKILDAYIVAIY